MSVIKNWIRQIKEGKLFYGLELTDIGQLLEYRLVVSEIKNDAIEVVSKNSYADFEELTKFIPKGAQVFLVYNTRQVIKKDVVTHADPYKQVKQGFPNVKLEEFYYESYSEDGTNAKLAICRQEVIDSLFKKFEAHKIYITQWSLNSMLWKSLRSQLEAQIEVEPTFYSAFAATYANASKNRSSAIGFEQAQQIRQQLFYQERMYKYGLPGAVGIILFALIVNFLFFNSYFSEIQELRELNTLNSSQKELLQQLQKTVAKKEQLIKDVQQSSSSKSSYYIDQIIQTLPKEIRLDELEYQPLVKTIKEDQEIEFEVNTIVIQGETNETRILSQWISDLEQLVFVTNLAISDFQKLEDSKNSGFRLNLEIEEL